MSHKVRTVKNGYHFTYCDYHLFKSPDCNNANTHNLWKTSLKVHYHVYEVRAMDQSHYTLGCLKQQYVVFLPFKNTV